jgi:outer membrane protein assembly factor BamB
MRMGDGHFSPEDLRWLDSVLVNLSDKNQPERDFRPLFFVTHYPIDPSIDNWYELLDRAKRYNTQAMLCGHGHRNKALDFEGTPGVMGRSNLRARDLTGGYTIAEIKADSIFFFERITGKETKPAWHQLALGPKNFAADTARYARPDFSINQKHPQVKAKWAFATHFTIASAPAIWKNRVFVGNSNGVVYGLSLDDGKEQWRFQTGKAVYSTPAIANGKVVFGAADGQIYCLSASNAKRIWEIPTSAPVVATPVIENGVVYVGGSDGKFRAIHLETGKLNWEYAGVTGFVETKPLVYAGKVIFGAWDTFLYALNLEDGALAWKWTNGNPGVLYSPAACWPVAAHGKIFIAAPDRFMTAIEASSGKTVWRSNRHQVREAIGLSKDGATVFARCMTDTLLAFSSSTSMPQLQWLTPCGYGYDIDPSMPQEKDGTIFFGTKNGFVFAVDAKSGAVKWQHRVGVTVINTVAPIAANRVVVTDMDGRVIMLAAE